MQAKIASIIYPEGREVGLPVLLVDFLSKGAKEYKWDKIVEEILTKPHFKTVVIKGKLSDDVELKTLVAGLVVKGKKVIFITPAKEDIGPLRPLHNLKFVLVMKPMTGKKETCKASNLALLKEEDDIKIVLGNKQDYEDAKVFLNSKVITRPTVWLDVSGIEQIDFLEDYLEKDIKKLKCKTRFSKVMKLI